MDNLQRRQLRILLGVRFTTHVSNEETHGRSGKAPIPIQIVKARWTNLDHILKCEHDRPVNKVVLKYLVRRQIRSATNRSRLLTIIKRILQKDLSRLSEENRRDTFAIIKLTSSSGSTMLQNKAQNRSDWTRGIEKIVAESVGHKTAKSPGVYATEVDQNRGDARTGDSRTRKHQGCNKEAEQGSTLKGVDISIFIDSMPLKQRASLN